jgi:hypothetical protein
MGQGAKRANYLLPSTRPHLLKVPLPPNNAISQETYLQHMSFW